MVGWQSQCKKQRFFVQSFACLIEQQMAERGRQAYGLVGDDAELAGATVTAAADELERRVARGHAAAQYHVRERAAHLVPSRRLRLSIVSIPTSRRFSSSTGDLKQPSSRDGGSRPDWAPPARCLASEDERDGPAWTGNYALPASPPSAVLLDPIGAVPSLAAKGNIGIRLVEDNIDPSLLCCHSSMPF